MSIKVLVEQLKSGESKNWTKLRSSLRAQGVFIPSSIKLNTTAGRQALLAIAEEHEVEQPEATQKAWIEYDEDISVTQPWLVVLDSGEIVREFLTKARCERYCQQRKIQIIDKPIEVYEQELAAVESARLAGSSNEAQYPEVEEAPVDSYTGVLYRVVDNNYKFVSNDRTGIYEFVAGSWEEASRWAARHGLIERAPVASDSCPSPLDANGKHVLMEVNEDFGTLNYWGIADKLVAIACEREKPYNENGMSLDEIRDILETSLGVVYRWDTYEMAKKHDEMYLWLINKTVQALAEFPDTYNQLALTAIDF